MYLESSATSNVTWYNKLQFVEKRVIALQRGDKPIHMHIMVREPQSVAEGSKGKEQVVVRAL